MGECNFSFKYRFKRGDVCNHCGTVFGYELKREASAARERGFFDWSGARVYLQTSKDTLKTLKTAVLEETDAKACPKCGQAPSEAYANVFTLNRAYVALLAPLGGGFLAYCVANYLVEFGAEALYDAFWEIFWGGAEATAAYLAVSRTRVYQRYFGRARTKIKSGAKIWGVRPECATMPELIGRREFATLGAWEIAFCVLNAAVAFLFASRLISPSFFTTPGGATAGAFLGAALLAALIRLSALAKKLKRPEVRFQGERHFACDWEYRQAFETEARRVLGKEADVATILAQLPELEAFLAEESARTVEVLRAATELTPEGAEALRIAEAEIAAAGKSGDAA